MKASDITEPGVWFMTMRNTKWYKYKRTGTTYVEAYVIGNKKKYLIPKDEEVMIRK